MKCRLYVNKISNKVKLAKNKTLIKWTIVLFVLSSVKAFSFSTLSAIWIYKVCLFSFVCWVNSLYDSK